MNFKANYEAVNLTSSAPFSFNQVANTASTIHQVVCLTNGTIVISALGGGTFSWAATANEKMDVLIASATVSSGTFVGFKSKFYPNQGLNSFGPY